MDTQRRLAHETPLCCTFVVPQNERMAALIKAAASRNMLAGKCVNTILFTDPDFDAFIYPVRDGLIMARRKAR
jgi:hypothetical protein